MRTTKRGVWNISRHAAKQSRNGTRSVSMLLRERCLVTLSAVLVLELEGMADLKALDTMPLCVHVSLLPTHLKLDLLSLVIQSPVCSAAVLATLLASDMDRLELEGYNLNDTSALERAWTFRQMGDNVTHIHVGGLALQASDFDALIHRVPQLQALDVSYNKHWHDKHTLNVLLGARQLVEMNLNWCHNVTDVSASHIARRGSNLKRLGLTGTSISSVGVVKLRCCTLLEELSLQACDAVDTLPRDLLHLQAIDLRGLSYIPERTLVDFIAPVWRRLRQANLGESNLSSASLADLFRHGECPLLESLDLSWCFQLTNNAILACFEHAPSLKTIKLRCVDVDNSCLLAIGKSCRQLVKLNVARCRNLTDHGLVTILKNCRQLREIDLSWSLVSNAAVVELVSACPHLARIRLQGCKCLTRHLMHDLVQRKSLAALQYMDLSWVDDIVADDIAQVVARHPSLQIKGYFGEIYHDDMSCYFRLVNRSLIASNALLSASLPSMAARQIANACMADSGYYSGQPGAPFVRPSSGDDAYLEIQVESVLVARALLVRPWWLARHASKL
ncbi:hypothetical protein AC1031_006220 [Aphanomyces cochlioides]|nr:hypothetical protein AC1031_006220 [Aphanomyces cochlioides]